MYNKNTINQKTVTSSEKQLCASHYHGVLVFTATLVTLPRCNIVLNPIPWYCTTAS